MQASSNLFPMGEDFSIEVFEELEVNNEHSTETNILNADNIVNSVCHMVAYVFFTIFCCCRNQVCS